MQLSSNGLSQVKTQQVFVSKIGSIEGSRFYKIKGKYYIFNTLPASAEYVLQASSPFGPYTQKLLESNIATPVSGSGVPHQVLPSFLNQSYQANPIKGGIVDTPNGDWYYMAFIDNYPGGRTPVLAPITWGSDGFPILTTQGGRWGTAYTYPLTPRPLASPIGTDTFSGTALSPQWEWNHNPDPTYYTVNNGLTLRTATVTTDLYKARNTLTHRIHGPTSRGTIELAISSMKAGDRSGLAMLRDNSAYVAVVANGGGSYRISQVSGLTMDAAWNTLSQGYEVAGANLASGVTSVWLRASADIHPGTGRTASFAFSTDGKTFTAIGNPYALNNTWQFFMGYRYGIFNYASAALGGSVGVRSFAMDDGSSVTA